MCANYHQHRWAVRDPAAQHFVRTTLVAKVEFSDWTPDSQVRHAKYLGLRIDKDAKTVKRESAVMPQGPALVTAGSSVVGDIKVSHPERVIDASTSKQVPLSTAPLGLARSDSIQTSRLPMRGLMDTCGGSPARG